MKKILIAIIMCLSLMLTACGEPDAGEIYDKSYRQGYYKTVSVTDYQYTCLPEIGFDGKLTNVCRNRYAGSHNEQRWVEECYEIFYVNGEDKGSECVGSERYESLSLGEWFEK